MKQSCDRNSKKYKYLAYVSAFFYENNITEK